MQLVAIVNELILYVRSRFQFFKVVRFELSPFLSRFGWRMDTVGPRQIEISNGRLYWRISFRVEGPSLLSVALWIVPEDADSEVLRRAKTVGLEYGPFPVSCVVGFIEQIYPPPELTLLPSSWSELKSDLRRVCEILCRCGSILTPNNTKALEALATYNARVNAEYFTNMILRFVGPELAAKWRDKSKAEINDLYLQWLREREERKRAVSEAERVPNASA